MGNARTPQGFLIPVPFYSLGRLGQKAILHSLLTVSTDNKSMSPVTCGHVRRAITSDLWQYYRTICLRTQSSHLAAPFAPTPCPNGDEINKPDHFSSTYYCDHRRMRHAYTNRSLTLTSSGTALSLLPGRLLCRFGISFHQ